MVKTSRDGTVWAVPRKERARNQALAQLQLAAAHLHWAVQAQACCWQPQVQAAPAQAAHWQFDWMVVFMAFLRSG